MKKTLIAIAAIAMLAGCSSSDGATTATTTTGAPATTSPAVTAPVTVDQSMLVRQWGSEMAGPLDGWDDVAMRLQFCALDGCGFDGAMDVLTASTMAKTVPVAIDNARRDIGAVPDELELLIYDIDAAAEVVADEAAAMGGCEWPTSGRCADQLDALNRTMSAMGRAITPWGPYL